MQECKHEFSDADQTQKCSLNSTKLLLAHLFTQLQQETQQSPSAPPAAPYINLPSMGSLAPAMSI